MHCKDPDEEGHRPRRFGQRLKLVEDQIVANIERSINFLVSLLKKGWQNVKSLYIKTMIGTPCGFCDAFLIGKRNQLAMRLTTA